MSKRTFSLWDRVFLALFILGIFFLGMTVGAGATYYKWPGFGWIMSAFRGGETAVELWRENAISLASPPSSAENKEKSLQQLAIAKASWQKDAAFNGYTLISFTHYSQAYLLDMQGKIVHAWDMPFAKAWPNPTHVHHGLKVDAFVETAYAFPNGDLIAQYTGKGDTPYGYGIVKMDKDSNVLWTYSANAHHDFYVAKNGDIYALVHQFVYGPIQGMETFDIPILADFIVRLSPEGKELQRVSLIDAFLHSEYAGMLKTKVPRYHKQELWDNFHTNSIMKLEPDMAAAFPLFKPGQVLISIRNTGTLAVVDLEAKRVVWAMKGEWRKQHDARFLTNGRIGLFDNEGIARQEKTPRSRVLEIDPQTGTIMRDLREQNGHTFFTSTHGRVQELPNGNLLIAISHQKRAFEVTPDDKIVWSLYVPRLNIVSLRRYSAAELPFISTAAHPQNPAP